MKTNTPNALRGREPPKGAAIVGGQSMWSSRIRLAVVLVFGLGLFCVGWNIQRIFPEWHVSARYLLMGFGGLLALIGLWPSAWRRRFLGFIATWEGIYTHGQGNHPDGHEWAAPDTQWLFVPWSNVVDVRVGRVLKVPGGPPGGTWWPSTRISLRVTPEEARKWFPYADDEPDDAGKCRIVSLDYSDSDPSPEDTVPKLKRLWEKA